MNRKATFAIFFLISALIFLGSSFVAAACNSTQVDINSANASDLDRIYGIGAAKAQNIIDYRSTARFNSVDDLTGVSGIGDTTLEDIKRQGLACVADNVSSSSNTTSDNTSVSESSNTGSRIIQNNADSEMQNRISEIENPEEVPEKTSGANQEAATHGIIKLSPVQSANKTKANFSLSAPGNLAIYGFVAFSILLGILLAARKFKTKRYKSEFE